MPFIFPRRHRHYKLTLWLMVVELPITVAILTLTGIASHNLYRTLLWQDGADNGFNSAPNAALYAAANYRPYTTPMVWSTFLDNFNLIIGVLSTFLLIVKFPVHCLHLFFPPIGAFIHGGIMILYIISARFQASSDTSDPKHPQPGAPWYIAKNCDVAAHKSNIHYCQQAKSLFAVTIIIIVLYFIEFAVIVHSCFVTKAERDEILEQREEKRIEKEFEEEIMKSPSMIPMTPAFFGQDHPGMIPRTPGYPPAAAAMPVSHGEGLYSPFTHRPGTGRTPGFNRLGSGSTCSDLPLRDRSNLPTPQGPPEMPQGAEGQNGQAQGTSMYFPPPPKKASNK
ncbi:Uncharacterized protein PECH_007906 [Penicillium ucsense]|uniref:MARVEL domain-containing protein n=1 Tax=Penicillium ucsense TaxID=2839758 RepID=A0A8J8W0Y2_9EURO|nr:Uncharacterized protein PECM_007054 [Penicillium ucsense]KAF7734540.1 Uncharacterized protein PECH_007906 [Penicillium ucsense]